MRFLLHSAGRGQPRRRSLDLKWSDLFNSLQTANGQDLFLATTLSTVVPMVNEEHEFGCAIPAPDELFLTSGNRLG